MIENKKVKLLSLIIGIISLSTLIIGLIITKNSGVYEDNRMSYTDSEGRRFDTVITEFYKSEFFKTSVFLDILSEFESSVEDSYEYDENESNNEVNHKDTVKEDLLKYKNMNYFVINKHTNEITSNTKYKTIKDAKKKLKGYCTISISNDTEGNFEYTKTIEGKTINSNNKSEETTEIRSDEVYLPIDIYVTFPKRIEKGDGIYSLYESFLKRSKVNSNVTIVLGISTIICCLAFVIYIKNKSKLFRTDSLIIKIAKKTPLEVYLLYFIMFFYQVSEVTMNLQIDESHSIIISTLILSTSLFLILVSYKRIMLSDKKLDILNNSIVKKYFFEISTKIQEKQKSDDKLTLSKKIVIVAVICIIVNLLGILFQIGISYSFSYNLLQVLGSWYGIVLLTTTLTLSVLAYYTISKLKYLDEIIKGVKKIKSGDLNYKIEEKENDELKELAVDINNIGEGLDKATEEQLKSERMKSDLITNVSHDLKTPLTSIINYIELIKKEEHIEPEHLNDYVKVLDSKSKRLKSLIEDLFEASKASSGNIELNIEKIDLTQLLRQSIGEMEDKLDKLNLDIKLRVPEEKIYINADGKRLNRVIENLLSNISKYSLENTRVYIDMIIEDKNAILTFKNISSYELNFDAEEIMERFKRADESRNTEGSGLGLAIAKDLVKIQGGELSIDIDGDLFKVTLKFNILVD